MFKEGHVYRFQDEDYMRLYSTFDNSIAAIIGENFFEVLSTDANGNILSMVVIGMRDGIITTGDGDRYIINSAHIDYFVDGGVRGGRGKPQEEPVDTTKEEWYVVMTDDTCISGFESYEEALKEAAEHKMANPTEEVEVYKRMVVATIGVSFV